MAPRRCLTLALALLAFAIAATGVGSEHARATEPQRLFALDADQGMLDPLVGETGEYRLTLEGVRPQALFFTDRPEREVGTVAVRPMLRRLFAGDSPPPNAAINATGARPGQLLMGIEISGWHYDARHRRLTLRVRHLPQGGRAIGDVRQDGVLPPSFHHVSIFIDDCCGVAAPATAFNTGAFKFTLSVNNGSPFEVPTASSETWLPGSAAIGFNPSSGQPQPGVLGPGSNILAVTPFVTGRPIYFEIDIPDPDEYDSFQIYIFLRYAQLEWTFLGDGLLIASSATP